MAIGPEGVDPQVFHRAYQGQAPWDMGHPQPEVLSLLASGLIQGPVLDVGCGNGANAIGLARAGLDVTAIDFVPAAIEQARARDADGLVEWVVGDALRLDQHLDGRRFATVLDAGVFHVFGDADRVQYVQQLRAALVDRGHCHVIVFSDKEGGDDGPRRVRADELRAAFKGWKEEALVETRYMIRSRTDGAHAWRGTWRV